MLTPHGVREWGLASVLAVVLAVPAALVGWWWAVGLLAVAWLSIAGFFRDPPRRIPPNLEAGELLSPADGRISKVFEVPHHEATGGPAGGAALVIRIFLSVLDVHVNRAPCDGEVVSVTHRPGRYLDARTEESARVNESNLIVLRRDGGDPIGVRQVSGAIARRIVCPLRPGDRVARGARFGMIKFGSTTELILPQPARVTVRVKEGDRVVGGITPLAELPIATAPAAD